MCGAHQVGTLSLPDETSPFSSSPLLCDAIYARLPALTLHRVQVRSLDMRLKHMSKQDSQKSLHIEELQAKNKALQDVNLKLRAELERVRSQLIEEEERDD